MASRQVVVLEYDDLTKGADLGKQLLEAWGPGSLGVVCVRGIPGWEDLYKSVLKLSHPLAHLPQESLKALEHEASMYNAGWSHGKEKLGDKPDFAKGSFYFNPLSDSPGTEEDQAKFPWALPKNLWPKEEIPELEKNCKALGTKMQEVIGFLGEQVDRVMATKVKTYTANLGKTLRETNKCKGRLLYYFPPKETPAPEEKGQVAEDGWIGWHNDSGFMTGLTPDMFVDDTDVSRVKSVTSVMKALLFHVHNWFGISKLLQDVHKVGAKSHNEAVRWTCMQIIGELCRAAPIVAVPTDGEGHNDLGDWCECLALLLPRVGDSSKAVASASIDCMQQLLARCEFTATLRVGSLEEYLTLPQDTSALLDEIDVEFSGVTPLKEESEELRGDPAPVSQQLVGSLLQRLPQVMPAMVQQLMPAMHDVDSHAAMAGVDAMHLLLRSCELTVEATANIVSSIFEEVEKVRHSSVRQLVLSCIKVLAMHHFDIVIEELLETGPDFNMSIMGALQVMAKENTLLLKLLNHFAAILNYTDPGPPEDPSRKVLAATVALGHLFTVNDSTMGAAVKKYFSQLFGTFLLRIGTTTEGLSAQQAAGAFMNFLHASQNDSMAMALEGNRLAKVTKEFYDEVICELVTLYCRHQPRRRETLLHFLQPFLAAQPEGHRVAAATTMSQVLLSCIDNPMDEEVMHTTLCSVVAAIEDPDATVRKQAVRGLGNVANLWHHAWEAFGHLTTEETIQEVLRQMCRLLSDEASAVRREAVLAMQRACQVPSLPQTWRLYLLINSPQHLPLLLDAEDTLLRGASLDLLGRLCELATSNGNAAQEADFSFAGIGEMPQVSLNSLDVFTDSLLMMVMQCTIRLEDSSSAVAAAASRCLRHITGTYVFQCASSSQGGSQEAEEAWELLQRWEQAQMDFEQFIFPFMAVLHIPRREDLALKRLQLCQRYLALKPQDFLPPGAPPRTAAGFAAIALLRQLQHEDLRPSYQVCSICEDLLDLLSIEDLETKTQAARLLGLLDLGESSEKMPAV